MNRVFTLAAQAAVLVALLLLAGVAFATGKPPVTHPSMQQSQTAQGGAGGNATGGSAVGGNVSSDAWAVALPGHGSPSYAGQFSICVRGKGVLWNAVWSWEPDLECVREIARVTAMAATPVPKPATYPMADNAPQRPTHAEQAAAACVPPAKAKSVTAAKAAGACKS